MLVLKKQGHRRTPQTLAPSDTLTIKGNHDRLSSEATTFYFKHVFLKNTRSSPQLNWPFPHVSSGSCSATGVVCPHHTFSLLVNASFAELRVHTGSTCLANQTPGFTHTRGWDWKKKPSPIRLKVLKGCHLASSWLQAEGRAGTCQNKVQRPHLSLRTLLP